MKLCLVLLYLGISWWNTLSSEVLLHLNSFPRFQIRSRLIQEKKENLDVRILTPPDDPFMSRLELPSRGGLLSVRLDEIRAFYQLDN